MAPAELVLLPRPEVEPQDAAPVEEPAVPRVSAAPWVQPQLVEPRAAAASAVAELPGVEQPAQLLPELRRQAPSADARMRAAH